MTTLGGSLFIRNGIQYDYSFEPAILGLLDICDDFVVLDCQSDDGTTERLRELAAKYPKIRLFENGNWNCADNYSRLKILANEAIAKLDTDWHFMIQADEVLHEESLPHIKMLVERNDPSMRAYMVKRIHLFGNMDHYLRHDLPTTRKPSSDQVIRLARKGVFASGDAESLDPAGFCSSNHVPSIVLMHYSFVRKNEVNISRSIDMQTWFHGPGGQPDKRLLELRDDGNVWRPEKFFSWEEFAPLYLSHPTVAKAWADERRGDHPKCPGCSAGQHE